MRRLTLLLAAATVGIALLAPPTAHAQVLVTISVAPPLLPVYVAPPVPGPDYLWAPGYWAYEDDDYYWVPGTWVLAPSPGLLWTPGYWAYRDGYYGWNRGYWGPHVGFYGGVNYGWGYGGIGYEGGYWRNNAFYYNTNVVRISNATTITNVYQKTVVVNTTTVNNVSYNGGTGGLKAQPSPAETAAASENHVQPTAQQTEHEHTASTNKANFAAVNHGAPPIVATPKAGVFSGPGVVAAHPIAAAVVAAGAAGAAAVAARRAAVARQNENPNNAAAKDAPRRSNASAAAAAMRRTPREHSADTAPRHPAVARAVARPAPLARAQNRPQPARVQVRQVPHQQPKPGAKPEH